MCGLAPASTLREKSRRDGQHAVDFAIAQILQRRRLIVVGHRVKGARIGGDGLEHFLQLERRHAVILIHDADLQVFDFAAKGIAEHDQLHQRHDDGDDNQNRTAPEAAQIAFDDGPDAVHSHVRFMIKGLSAALGACRLSRI